MQDGLQNDQDAFQRVADCVMCDKVRACAGGTYPGLIEEFRHSFFVVGDHQFFPGYCMVISKNHVRDMMDLPTKLQLEIMHEVLFASRAIQLEFKPWKLNHASLGNQVTHIHWHIFPRYEADPDLKQHPWFHADEFHKHKISDEETRAIAQRLRSRLDEIGFY
jgi:diadenosine tetraphosphate (Ap4A) HIT family hydrolase